MVISYLDDKWGNFMTVYNVNLGIGWASSGVEYAQAYRSQLFQKLGVDAKFVFSDMILANNIQDLTSNLGFLDDQIIWLYNFFTDVKIAPSDYPLQKFEKEINFNQCHFKKQTGKDHKSILYVSDDEKLTIIVRLHNADKETIDQATYLSNGVMQKRDFYSYVRYAREYYAGTLKGNHVVSREFYNEDGSKAYTQLLDGKNETFLFPDKIYYSKNELYAEMIKRLNFKADDVIILDRMNDGGVLINGQIIFEHHRPAKLVIVVHADHYDVHSLSRKNILWNNFYEYQFTHTDDVAAYVVSTDKQRNLFVDQERRYYGKNVNVVTIPVGSLATLKHPHQAGRKKHALITASRLAMEKHIDWLIKAVVQAHESVKDVSLDIYGKGGQEQALRKLITDNHAEDYIRLMGQHDLTDVYINYATYIAASTSEGFGLSLLEAVGSGLPMIGFDVPYGNQTFIENKKNGFLLPYQQEWDEQKKIQLLSQAIVKMFTSADEEAFSQRSYEVAKPYLKDAVANQWARLLEDLQND